MDKRDKMTKAIRDKGTTMVAFCENVLKTDYKAFRYRVREGCLRLDEYKAIIAFTGQSFEELWSEPVEQAQEPEQAPPVQQTQDDEFIDTW